MKIDFAKIANVFTSFMKKNSPYILTGVGATAITAGTVVIVKKAKAAPQTIDKEESLKLEVLHKNLEGKDEKTVKKSLAKRYTRRAVNYARYYGAPILLISGGVMSMASAMLIQTKRLQIMSASYTALAAAFNNYRDKVKAAIGDEKEEDIYYGIKRDEKGNIISQSEQNPDAERREDNTTEFSRLFGEGNTPFWSKDTRLCVLALKGAESNINNLLRIQGFVTLNDVWKELGFRPSEEGMYLGWRYKQGDPVYGDTYISLGYSGPKNEEKCEVLRNSWKAEMWIDLVPPHTLFGKLPKEKIRTNEEKERIKENRKRVVVYEEPQ